MMEKDNVKNESEEEKEFLPGFPSVDSYSQAALKQIMMTTKSSNSIPGEKREDWDYYDTFKGFRNVMSKQNSTIRSMIKTQLEYNGIKGRVSSTDVEELLDILSDANDVILERIGINLDDAEGIKRDADPLLLEVSQSNVAASGSWNNFVRGAEKQKDNSVKLLAAKNVSRPQIKFSKFIDNSDSPFQPRLTEKPHSMKPLSILVEYDDQGKEVFSHPYIFEMERDEPVSSQLIISVAVKPPDIDATQLMYVDTSETLNKMIEDLKSEQIIGVDVEAHTYRSYLGITCLIQISTATKDYLVDPFPVWSDLPLLNEITANPKIIKVLHGCDGDVEWLQRDFSVYLRNVFDTHQAGKILGLPRLSLAWLLSNYCGIDADKKYQLADWRIRPLPKEMIYYARQDTRYLIYLYTRLKNELISRGNAESNLLHACLHQSNDICKKRYTKPLVREDSHLDLVRKARANLNNKQLFCLKEIFTWRDKVARVEDESVHFVLPNHMMLKICTELPREMQGILACCNPVPPLVKMNLGALHTIVHASRDKQLLSVDPALLSTPPQADFSDLTSNYSQSPLDLSHLEESGDLETVVKNKFTFANNNLLKDSPELSVFSYEKRRKRPNLVSFISPYQRYTLLKPYLASLERSSGDPNDNQGAAQGGDINISSIKEHFEKLTEMTPTRVTKKVEEEEEEKEESAPSSDDEVEPNKPYFEDPSKPYVETKEKISNMREGAQKSSKSNKKNGKRKSMGGCFKCGAEGHFARDCSAGADNSEKKIKKPDGKDTNGCKNGKLNNEVKSSNHDSQKKKHNLKRKSAEPTTFLEKVAKTTENKQTEFDYNNVDYKNFGSSNLKNQDFDPYNTERDKKKFLGAKKKQQFNKKGGKSHTFKRT